MVLSSVSDQVQVLDRLVGEHDPMLVFEIAFATLRPCQHVSHQMQIFGMDPGADQIERYHCAGIELEDAVELLRPYDFPVGDIPGKIAHSSEVLAFCKEGL